MLAVRRSVQGRIFVTLQNREFRLLWGASLLGNLALSMGLIIPGWIVLEMTDDPWAVAQVVFYFGVTQFVVTIFVGTLSDRFSRKSLLVLGSSIRLIPWIFLIPMMYMDRTEPWHILVASGVFGVGVGLETTTARVVAHDLVGNQGIVNALSLESLGRHVMRGIGPLLGGVLLDVSGGQVALTAIAVSQTASLALLMAIRLSQKTPPDVKQGSFFGEMIRGAAYVSQNQMVLALVIGATITNIFLIPMIFVLPVFAREILHTSASGLGVLTAVGAVGSVVGALVMANNPKLSRPGLTWLEMAYFLAIVTILFAWSPWFSVSMLLLILHGLTFAAFGALQPSLVILASEESMRGRTSGAMALAMSLAQVGALVLGGLIEVLGVSMGLATSAGISMVLLTLLMIMLPVLTRDMVQPKPVRVV